MSGPMSTPGTEHLIASFPLCVLKKFGRLAALLRRVGMHPVSGQASVAPVHLNGGYVGLERARCRPSAWISVPEWKLGTLCNIHMSNSSNVLPSAIETLEYLRRNAHPTVRLSASFVCRGKCWGRCCAVAFRHRDRGRHS